MSRNVVAPGYATIPDFTGVVILAGSAMKPDVQTMSSVASGAASPISDLSVTVTPRAQESKFRLTASILCSTSSSVIGLAFRRGSTVFPLGDSGGSRTPVFLAGRPEAATDAGVLSLSPTAIDEPNTLDPITYEVVLINLSGSASNLFVNRSRADTDGVAFPRGASTLFVEEIVANL